MKLSEILKDQSTITLSTVDGDNKAKSRVFQHQFIVDGKVFFATSNQSTTFAELKNNSHVEFSQFENAKYIRVAGTATALVGEEKVKYKAMMAELNPGIVEMYTPEGFEAKMEIIAIADADVRVKDFADQSVIEVTVE